MNLEIKHIAPYLPYGLIMVNSRGTNYILSHLDRQTNNGISNVLPQQALSEQFKPILKPLSDFDKLENDLDLSTEFESSWYNGGGDIVFINTNDKTYMSDAITVTTFLFENHFDVFGLIEKELAIDINKI